MDNLAVKIDNRNICRQAYHRRVAINESQKNPNNGSTPHRYLARFKYFTYTQFCVESQQRKKQNPATLDRLLCGDVEIEHIFPYSSTLDDSMGNKTVATKAANRAKGNRTPFEAFGQQKQAGYDYAAILQRVTILPNTKRQHFAPDGYQLWLTDNKDFLARALTDTAYLSRIAREYLSCICPQQNTLAIPNRMTATLRGKFGLNQLLPGAAKQANRDDHRHHAIDAMVIGITDRRMLQNLAAAAAHAHEIASNNLVHNFPLPWPTYREHVARALASIYVSYKPEHGYQGAMHEETAWGLLDNGQVQRKVRTEAGGAKERQIKNMRAIGITDATQKHRHGVDKDSQPKAYKGYLGGNNYCMEIGIDESGRWQSHIISTFDAYQIIRQFGADAGWQRLRHPKSTQSGQPLVMRVSKQDYIRLEIDGQTRTMIVAKISGNGQIFMADHNEANMDARNRDKTNLFAYISKTAGSLQKAHARKCTVSPTGHLRDPGFTG